MKTTDQLREQILEITEIKNEHNRMAAALQWWESLSSDDQKRVKDEIIVPTV